MPSPELPVLLEPETRSTRNSEENVQRQRLYARLRERPPAGITQREVHTHFRSMPAHYWERVTKTDLAWGLETAREFFAKAETAPSHASTVVADWRDCPERGLAKIMICAWDRPGLLAKIAAAFSALRISILRADVYTRKDHLALDLFEVSDLAHENPAERLKHLVFLLEGALSDPPRFVSLWASQFHKALPCRGKPVLDADFDNDYSSAHTIIRVRALDRLGLLHDLLRALADCGLNINEATVETEDGMASDTFRVTDLKGGKVLDPGRLDRIRKALIRSLS